MASNSLKALVGSDIIIVRNWHITTFTFLVAFSFLYVFFATFQPTTLITEGRDFIVPDGTSYSLGASASDLEKNNKLLSDRGRNKVFAYAIGLAALVGLFVHFMLMYIR
jgi:hypothetical protein